VSVLIANHLSKSYGALDVFRDLNLAIPHGARIGLVGVNGVGKTTLLRILAGEEEPTTGEVQIARNCRVGYLPQRPHFSHQRTIWQECLSAFAPLLQMQDELHALEARMSAGDHSEETITRYGKLQEAFERAGGYTYETRIRQTLQGLGFSENDYQRPLNKASGGQQTRALLARLLLSQPDLLLLDEPTNHLDIQAIEWLENTLKEWQGAVLLVSHDRYFLDQVAEQIWEMTPALEMYPGNYTAYLHQREERYRRRMEEFAAQQAFIEKEEEYIRRNIAGQNTAQAKGRLKRLERLLETARLTPPVKPRALRLQLTPLQRSGDLVLRTHALAVGYPDERRVLFRVPDLTLRRGECAAVIGPNGAGKTTFLKTILGILPPLEGEVTLGASLQVGYFAQAHEGLNPDHTLMEEIAAAAPHMLPGQIRDYLARFLFTEDDVFKPVRVLSGGERGRLALAVLALSKANLLLLDEPTNHLDLPSQEILQAVLSDYEGTVLLVSHDRYLIDALATQIWEVIPEARTLRVFEGTYSQYREVLRAEEEARRAQAAPVKPAEKPAPRSTPSRNRERERIKRQQALEAEIHRLEEQLAVLSRALESPPPDPAKVLKLGQDYQNLQQTLEQKLHEWLEGEDH